MIEIAGASFEVGRVVRLQDRGVLAVIGTLHSGVIAAGDRLQVQGSMALVDVRGLEFPHKGSSPRELTILVPLETIYEPRAGDILKRAEPPRGT
jgi:hypothetical protein